MVMKRSVTILFFLLLGFSAVAQNIAVKSFKQLMGDMTTSSLEGKRIDQNGEVAALIKVVTTETGFVFEGGTLGIVDTKQRVSEVWVWVPRGLRKITILHPQLGQLRNYTFPVEIEADRTYEMVLVTGKVETIIKEEVRMQYLTFQITPPNATLEVDDKLWSVDADGNATKYVDFGTYTYRVRASDYFTEAGKVTVDDPNNTKLVVVNLKPNFAEVTLTVDADAEIWVNNEKKGIRTWTGPLGDGTYKIECKQAGHETTMISKEITKEMSGETITLPVPKPIYGSLNVESKPNLATLYIDGEEVGTTPKSINEILVGKHEVRFSKEGYDEYTDTIIINEGERAQMKVKLYKNGSTPPPTEPQQPQLQQQVAQQPSSVFFVMLNTVHGLLPQTSFGLTVGSAKKLGWYASLNTNFKSKKTEYECDQTGTISGMSSAYAYSGNKSTSRFGALAGVVCRIYDPLYVYAGGGYGFRNMYWELEDGNWVKSTDDSYQGIALDAGLMLHFNGFGLSMGVQTIGVKYMEIKFGIGYTLKRR